MTLHRAKHDFPEYDIGFLLIVLLVAAIVVWLMLMPICPAIARSTINRMHLNTRSFPLWVAQQPIPAMYNLSNRFRLTRMRGDASETVVRSKSINHFPTRVITFANGRYVNLHKRGALLLEVSSSYRGLNQRSSYLIEPTGSVFEMSRIRHSLDADLLP